jgi:hypothetical protein
MPKNRMNDLMIIPSVAVWITGSGKTMNDNTINVSIIVKNPIAFPISLLRSIQSIFILAC